MSEALLAAHHLHIRHGQHTLLNLDHWQLPEGQFTAIIGPNGAGKTTVFNCASGFYRPSAGRVILDGHDITGKPSHVIAGYGLTRTFQNIRLFREMTVVENLLVARHNAMNRSYLGGIFRTSAYRNSERAAKNEAVKWLSVFGLRAFANHEAGSLAYGQQRRLEIARCMMTSPKVLILDEPAAGLNPSETAELAGLIRTLRDKYAVSILLIEHDMSLVMSLSEHIMVMEYGRPIAYGTPAEIRANPAVIKAYLGEE